MTKNLHHLKAGIKTVFSLGLGYHQIQIIELEILQRHGTQITVNTWTDSYTYILHPLLTPGAREPRKSTVSTAAS